MMWSVYECYFSIIYIISYYLQTIYIHLFSFFYLALIRFYFILHITFFPAEFQLTETFF